MHFYRVVLFAEGLPPNVVYHPTLGEAHESARDTYPKDRRSHISVQLVDVPTDKAGVLALLRGFQDEDFKAIKQWGITPRGGLADEEIEQLEVAA
jgi:hypothetical protein